MNDSTSKPKRTNRVQLPVTLPPDLHADVLDYCDEAVLSPSALVERVLRKFLNEPAKNA